MPKIRVAILLAFNIFFCHFLYSQSSYSVYVGERTLLACPNPPNANSAISQTSWASKGADLHLEKVGNACYVTVTDYFTGTEQVQCDYYWYWYDKYGAMHTNHATTYYNFQCRAVTITPSPPEMRLEVGAGQQLNYSVTPSNVYPQPTVRMISENTNVATVSNGYVRAVGPGTTHIRLTNNMGPEVKCRVTVEKIDPTSVKLPDDRQVYVGESVQLVPTVYPSNASTTFSWYSRNPGVARVSSDGTVTGVTEGNTEVYAISANGLRTNDCKISVSYRRPTSVSLEPASLTLPIGHKRTLKASVSPANSKYELTWDVSPKGIVSVASNGEVTALKDGSAEVTVRTDNGRTASCTVTVPPDPEAVSLPERIALTWHSTRRLKCAVTPSDAYSVLTWTSSDSKVASVTSAGEVGAVAPGTAEIKVRTQNGREARCVVEVDAPVYRFKVWMRSGEDMLIDLAEHPALRISDGNLLLVTPGHSVELDTADVRKFTIEDLTVDRMPEAIIIPETLELPFKGSRKIPVTLLPEGYDIETHLAWTSSRPDVVTVSQSGFVTAVAPGVAEIQVRATNGCTARCQVNVPAPDYHLFVWLSDGHHDAYSFDENPNISYQSGELVINTRSGEYRYEHANVHKVTFSDTDTPKASDTETSVSSVESDSPEMERRGDEVSMRGMNPGGNVYVYDIGGRLMDTLTVGEDGTLTFAISRLSSGIYIIKTETITFKIIKK